MKVYVPLLNDPLEEEAIPAAPEVVEGGGETILVVEDTEALRELICEILGEMGYTVLVATGGQEGIQVSVDHKGRIDLLLTDVVMPGMGGADLAKKLAIARPEMRVLYMSGYTDGVISTHGVAEHGVLLLEKPFTADRLARAVREALSAGGSSGAQGSP